MQEAEDWLLRAQKLAPKDPLVYTYLGERHFEFKTSSILINLQY